MKEIVIVNGARTPMAEYNGSFSDISAIDLAAIAAKEALSRKDYTTAEMSASEALRLIPNDRSAIAIKQEATIQLREVMLAAQRELFN